MTNAWDKAAAIRKEQIESGLDITFCDIFIPYYLKLIKREAPTTFLEVGCGTGHLLKEIVSESIDCKAVEPSPKMYEIAKEHLKDQTVNISCCKIEDFNSLEQYDLILSHLCAQAVTDLGGWLNSISQLLAPQGTFVFAIPHPCFYNDYKKLIPSSKYSYMHEIDATISLSITLDSKNTIDGVPYKHRPLNCYINILRKNGFCLIGLDEIYPSPEVQAKYGATWDYPRYLVFHARLLED
ncbi:class I SAM-dependent methyltransferase [Halodesulfovibrio spirochaetisodalis]|uniref:Methyltransferase type 12 domain-containing protein n=1 Tax=Halodesulfovibrio spirochaetisodalis TaxID=1560234 RepID=A0A1B7XMM1_9BACT|nr:class I SAM-dependent methyltransferase [Halodesulfovibrio spirochaetisodalis]OBQ56763.1 hypothetical protein SP90_01375 [Halodesulfovibrio spirochaetisodalis]